MPTRMLIAPDLASGGGARWLLASYDRVILTTASRREAGVADQALHLVGRRAVGRIRCRDDILLDHQRTEIVAAEAERELANLHSHRHPTRLQIRHVVEYDARDRDGAEIID